MTFRIGAPPRWPAILGLLSCAAVSVLLAVLGARWDAAHGFSPGKMAFMGLMLSGVALGLCGSVIAAVSLRWRGSAAALLCRRQVMRRFWTALLLLVLLVWLGFMVVEFTQGSAAGGMVVVGQHYLGSHGRYTAASPAKFRFVEWHEFLFFPMLLTALIAAAGRAATNAMRQADSASPPE